MLKEKLDVDDAEAKRLDVAILCKGDKRSGNRKMTRFKQATVVSLTE